MRIDGRTPQKHCRKDEVIDNEHNCYQR